MTFLARLALFVVWIALVLYSVAVWGLAFLDDFEPILTHFDLPTSLDTPPLWVVTLGSIMSLGLVLALGWAFLNMSRMLSKSKGNSFGDLAVYLRKSAWGFIGFWLLSTIEAWAIPELLTLHADGVELAPLDWILIDLETGLLAVGITFLSLSQSLRQAQEIENDNESIV